MLNRDFSFIELGINYSLSIFTIKQYNLKGNKMNKIYFFSVLFLACYLNSNAQIHNTKKQFSGIPDIKLMQEINDAWATLDPDKALKYYDQSSQNVFYDVSPLKYIGWSAYENGAKEVFKSLSFMKYSVGCDAVIHIGGNFAWGTATLHMVVIDKKGNKISQGLRWTPIWEKKGLSWLIVHEHLSAPLDQSK